ncbi:MAG: acetyl-CoA decarbonylase/synthase complex subunit delta [Candidatus Humimicrobiaceae bacterium]
MSFKFPKNEYAGKIASVNLKSGTVVGGDEALPFYSFEGNIPNKPIIAMEVYDSKPEGWPESVDKYFNDVYDDPVKWAKKCIDEYGAESICLQLKSVNPDSGDMKPQEAAEIVKKVSDAIEKPLIVYGDGPMEKIEDVMKKVSEVNQDSDILIGWVEEDYYKTVAAACMGYNNNVISVNSMDVNIAKQLNILLTQLGLPAERIVMDPSTASIGYGIEYCYSSMERLKIAALLQDDKMTQMPLIVNLAPQVWKVKEVKESEEDYPEWGDLEQRGINWESISAIATLVSGANIVVMRHPKAVSMVKEVINNLIQ